jgi:hypothetical protein
VTTGAPKVILGTKCPSIISICNQSAPRAIVFEHSFPRSAKSAERMEGAMMAEGAIAADLRGFAKGWQRRGSSIGASSIISRL